MATWTHRLSEIDATERTAVCAHCGPVRIRSRERRSDGTVNWRCAQNDNRRRHAARHPHRRHKGLACEREGCTATIDHPCQLDVHHTDGDHSNNDPANLRTLCANCHRLEHAERREAR